VTRARPTPRPAPRVPLSRERVLDAAFALADETGVESLSMRRLAKTLGVEAMSLYNHVGSKDDLLDGLVELVFEEIEPPPSGVDWRTAMRRRAVSTREALRRHPWAIGLMEARSKPGPASIALHEAVLKTLREAGFSLAETVHAYSVQDAYIYGFALQEKTLSHQTRDEWKGVARRIIREYGDVLDSYPSSAEVQRHIAEHGFSHEEEFLYGLELILGGLERLLGSD